MNSKGFMGEDDDDKEDEFRLEFFLILFSRRIGVVVKGVALFCCWNNNDGAVKEDGRDGDVVVMNISLLESVSLSEDERAFLFHFIHFFSPKNNYNTY